jgi:hypothetical protein
MELVGWLVTCTRAHTHTHTYTHTYTGESCFMFMENSVMQERPFK